MSKYSTDELIDRICWKDDDRVLGPNDPYYPIGEETKNAIIARLRAADKYERWFKVEAEVAGAVFVRLEKADKLCEVVKKVAAASAATLDKAIADYEGAGGKL